jgi:3-methyladenine DNA glycosylase/8-oxoguanine DNA glycosylase
LTLVAQLPLIGAGGEPVDFARTIVSHGVAELPPNRVDLDARTLDSTLPVPGGARTVRLTTSDGTLRIDAVAGRVDASARRDLAKTIAHMFRLDENLSGFYAVVSEDGDLSWCARGAGRMLRAPTVFEDVVKTICTTNTAWSGTRKMTRALVDNLGVEAPGGARTFPTAHAMAAADEAFYRDTARAGYRGPYLRKLAVDTADGVDSWTRPTYVKLSGARRAVKDATIERRFKRYGDWAGLAFWLYLTRSWVDEGLPV